MYVFIYQCTLITLWLVIEITFSSFHLTISSTLLYFQAIKRKAFCTQMLHSSPTSLCHVFCQFPLLSYHAHQHLMPTLHMTFPQTLTLLSYHAHQHLMPMLHMTFPQTLTLLSYHAHQHLMPTLHMTFPQTLTLLSYHAHQHLMPTLHMTFPQTLTLLSYHAHQHLMPTLHMTFPQILTVPCQLIKRYIQLQHLYQIFDSTCRLVSFTPYIIFSIIILAMLFAYQFHVNLDSMLQYLRKYMVNNYLLL